MAELAKQYQKRKGMSLRRFAQAAGIAHWQLRDYLKGQQKRHANAKTEQRLKAQIKRLALKHPTYGYRRIHQEVLKKGWQVGEHKVRKILTELDLIVKPKAKPRRELPEPTPAPDLPEGRRVQMDATQVVYGQHKAWCYLVEDTVSRTLLSIKPVKQLCKLAAATTLKEAQQHLRQQGITDPLVIQTDGGSDFTSDHFQTTCKELGSWHRSSIKQTQGMAILERLKKTFKYDFFFRQECEAFEQLDPLSKTFKRWYNHERIHSAIDYLTPWQKLKLDARL
jgi:transposase InsO family protein